MRLDDDWENYPDEHWAEVLSSCARKAATDSTMGTDVTQCPGFSGWNRQGRPGRGGPGPSGGSQSGMTAWSTDVLQKSVETCGKQSYCVNGDGCNGGLGCTCNALLQKASNVMLGVAQELMGTCMAVGGS